MIEFGFFMTTSNRSYPFAPEDGAFQDDRMYGRRLTNVTFSDADNALLSYEYTGQTAVILGNGYIPGIVVTAVRVNYQWYAIGPVNRETSTEVVGSGPDIGDPEHSPSTQAQPFQFPNTMELITTGDYKEALDGLYQLIPKHNGSGEYNSASSHYCVGTDLKRKPGASVSFTAEAMFIPLFNGNYQYTMTISHPNITTTVYQSLTDGTALTYLEKQSGDATLPDDVWWRFGAYANMPLWFDLESDDDSITGLYTLWPGYFDTIPGGSWNGFSKNYIHKADGTRSNVTYSGTLFSSPTDFRIQIGVPSGGAIRYQCDRDDFGTENGMKFTFDLESNTSSSSAPDTITVRRPQTGYTRTVTEQDQL